MSGRMERRWRIALLGAALALAALLPMGCSSEAEQPPAKSETAATQATPAAPAAEDKPQPAEPRAGDKPQTAEEIPATDQDQPAALLEQALQTLAQGDEARAMETVEAVSRSLWKRLPLRMAEAALVSEPAKGYGVFQPRKDNVYLVASPDRPVFPGKGQPMYVYLEPVNYGIRPLSGDRHEISFAMDVELMDGQGKHLYSKNDFMRVQNVSRRFQRQFFLNVTINLKGAPVGSYVLRLTLKDLIKGQSVAAELPVKLAMAPLEKK